MSSLPTTRYTPEQYLARERKAEFRSEYRNGGIVPMPSSNINRSRIIMNLVNLFSQQLGNEPEEVFAKDMRIKITAKGFCLYTYPDVLVTGNYADCEDEHQDTLLNPLIIANVFASENVGLQIGFKQRDYQPLTSLKEHLGIVLDHPTVYHWQRLPDRKSLLNAKEGLDKTICLQTVTCELPLSEIYTRVKFPPESLDPENEL